MKKEILIYQTFVDNACFNIADYKDKFIGFVMKTWSVQPWREDKKDDDDVPEEATLVLNVVYDPIG